MLNIYLYNPNMQIDQTEKNQQRVAMMCTDHHGACVEHGGHQPWWGGLDGGGEDGQRPILMPTAASWPKVPFKVQEFLNWVPSLTITCHKTILHEVLHSPQGPRQVSIWLRT